MGGEGRGEREGGSKGEGVGGALFMAVFMAVFRAVLMPMGPARRVAVRGVVRMRGGGTALAVRVAEGRMLGGMRGRHISSRCDEEGERGGERGERGGEG